MTLIEKMAEAVAMADTGRVIPEQASFCRPLPEIHAAPTTIAVINDALAAMGLDGAWKTKRVAVPGAFGRRNWTEMHSVWAPAVSA